METVLERVPAPKGWRFTFTVPEGCEAEAVVGGRTCALHAGENTLMTRD